MNEKYLKRVDMIYDATYSLFEKIIELKGLVHSAIVAENLNDGALTKAVNRAKEINQELGTELKVLERTLFKQGFTDSEVNNIKYAICALADEMALRGHTKIAVESGWLVELLQLKYFAENTAGEGFFNRLDRICDNVENGNNLAVLRVYYICLMLDFRGKYALETGKNTWLDINYKVKERLAAYNQFFIHKELSPHTKKTTNDFVKPLKKISWIMLGSLIVIGLEICLYAYCKISLLEKIGDFKDFISLLLKG